MYIYKITNELDGKIYVGKSTKTPEESKTYYGSVSFGRDIDISPSFSIVVESDDQQNNINPISRFRVSSPSGDTSTLFEFDASSSYDRDGHVVLYEWYFGDGNMIITKNAKCDYALDTAGNWDVACVIIDNEGSFDSSFKTVKVSSGGETPSLVGQNGVIRYNGVLHDAKSDVETDDSLDINRDTPCDLDVNVDMEFEDSITLKITVDDLSGTYDAESVDIQLMSNIPQYDLIKYNAKIDQDSGKYHLDIIIPVSHFDSDSYSIAIAAIPQSGFSETDWSGNRWSTIISEDINTISNELISEETCCGSISL